MIDEVVLAATTLASQRTGAIMVLEREMGLRSYIETGIALDAVLTYDLLISIFNPGTPLHDGAVIVQGNRVAAAACFLPLTVNPELSRTLGSRHRAAIGRHRGHRRGGGGGLGGDGDHLPGRGRPHPSGAGRAAR